MDSRVNSTAGAVALSETKRRLFEAFQHGQIVEEKPGPRLARRPVCEFAPLSSVQERLWMFETENPGIPPVYNESVTLRRFGSLDPEILERCLAEIIRRHEIWRTSYDTVNGEVVQVIHAASESLKLPRVDLRDLPALDREEEVLGLARNQTRQPFDLRNGPLLRAMLVRISEEEHRLLMTVHQSIIDGISVYQLFPTELAAVYQAFSAGSNSPLADLPIQFGDFAVWEREWLRGSVRERQIGFWRRKLSSDIPVLRWPAAARPIRQRYRGRMRSFTMPATVATAARILSYSAGTTLFTVLLAGFYTVLHQYTWQTKLIVGTFSPAGRRRSEVQSLFGYFLNPVPLPMDVSDDPSFVELIRRAHEITAEALSNDEVPFEDVVDGTQAALGYEPEVPISPKRFPFSLRCLSWVALGT